MHKLTELDISARLAQLEERRVAMASNSIAARVRRIERELDRRMPTRVNVVEFEGGENPPPLPADCHPIRNISVAIRRFYLKERSHADPNATEAA